MADLFDNTRSAIQINQRPCMGGLTWMSEWTNAPGGMITTSGSTPLGGHCIKIAGWKTINGVFYMVLQNSWGNGVGDNGLYYMSREVFNSAFQPFGVFYWSDDVNPTIKVLGLIQAIYQHIISLLTKGTGEGVYPPAIPKISLIPQCVAGIYEAEGNGTQLGITKGYNNGGDLRGKIGNKYLASLGATGYGDDALAIFPTLEIGTQACTQLVTDAVNGKLLAYKPTMTLTEFVTIYADPYTVEELNDYVSILKKHCGKVETISQLL